MPVTCVIIIYIYITVPDHLIMAVIRDRLSQMDALTRGWVLHGFPKNIDQAASLDQDGFKPNRSAYNLNN